MSFKYMINRHDILLTRSKRVEHMARDYVVGLNPGAVSTIANALGIAASIRATVTYSDLVQDVTLPSATHSGIERRIECEGGEILATADKKLVDDIIIHLTNHSYAEEGVIAAALVASRGRPSSAYVTYRTGLGSKSTLKSISERWATDLNEIYRYFKTIGR